MDILTYLEKMPGLYICLCGILGLLVGSFANVVILRLPVMMKHQWLEQCASLSEPDGEATSIEIEPDQEARFNLAYPPSHCPKCQHRIHSWENIPVISYLFLHGRCSACGQPIPIRYPVIEAACGLLSVIVAWHFGFGWQSVTALVLTWALLIASVIDFDHQLLPDSITLPLVWLGLLLSLFNVFVDSHTAIIGAAVGYLSLWTVFHLFKLLTGKEGMGYGDFKLLAVFGAWLGWQHLLTVILLSSLVGACVGIMMITLRGHDRQIPIPFGPYLATAGWVTLLWGNAILAAYMHWMGIR